MAGSLIIFHGVRSFEDKKARAVSIALKVDLHQTTYSVCEIN